MLFVREQKKYRHKRESLEEFLLECGVKPVGVNLKTKMLDTCINIYCSDTTLLGVEIMYSREESPSHDAETCKRHGPYQLTWYQAVTIQFIRYRIAA